MATDTGQTDRPRVSVIIPVHGVEAYIEDCIASVQAQDLASLEIITVNDASPDDAQRVIDRLAADDPRIRPMVLTENVGQGFARNRALEVATGEYVWFIDGDDWMPDPGFLSRAVALADTTASDMVRGRKLYHAVERKPGQPLRLVPDEAEQRFTETRAGIALADDPFILESWHFWLWLYRRSFLEDHGIRFALTQMEERPFVVEALLRADRISLLAVEATRYRQRAQSTMRRARTMEDNARLLQNLSLVVDSFDKAGAVDRASPLRAHLNVAMTQFLEIVFFREAFADVRTRSHSDRDAFWRQASAAFRRAAFTPADIVPGVAGQNDAALEARAYHLAVAGLGADDPAVTALAVDFGFPPDAGEVPDAVARTLADYAAHRPAAHATHRNASTVVNYGLFGWRLWGLAPVLALVVPRAQRAAFRAEPSTFAHRYWARGAALAFPTGDPAWPFRFWIPVFARILAAQGLAGHVPRFRRDPVKFVRTLATPLERFAGRLLFPAGELR